MSDWWRGALIYQIYPRSFYDSNGDGIGDLPGITSKLTYVAELGVDAIWISPFFKSPMLDFGYDISDYCAVDPMFGELKDFVALLSRAHELGLKVIIDQVISHSSEQHAWFKQSREDKTNQKANWYVWADAKEDGSAPNNWLSFFGGSAWTWEPKRQQYYLHNFLSSQPDLNFHNPAVQQAQLENLRFWLDLGVDGFRLDVANFYFHDEALRDNPVLQGEHLSSVGVTQVNPYSQQQHKYDISQPENLEFLQKLRNLMDSYPERTTMGEINGENALQIMAQYTQQNNRLHMAYTFDLLGANSEVKHISAVIAELESQLADGWPCWALGNHDVTRVLSRWGQDKDPIKFPLVAMALLICLRGTACIYQGEELGLSEADVAFEDLMDPYGKPFWPEYKGRDGCRTPMPWLNQTGAGFSTVDFFTALPWLPVEDAHLPLAVQEQQQANDSLLHQMQALIQWRQKQPVLVKGEQITFDQEEAFCWTREYQGERVFCAFNLSAKTVRFAPPVSLGEALSGHGFVAKLENHKLNIPPYQAYFAYC